MPLDQMIRCDKQAGNHNQHQQDNAQTDGRQFRRRHTQHAFRNDFDPETGRSFLDLQAERHQHHGGHAEQFKDEVYAEIQQNRRRNTQLVEDRAAAQ